jgi:Flp pilus assembly protein TadG
MSSLMFCKPRIVTLRLPIHGVPEEETDATEPVNMERICWHCRFKRQGAAAVEFALVAPIFFLMILGMMEVGRAIMVKQIVTNAAREGARVAVIDGSTVSTTVTKVQAYLTNAGMPSVTPTVTPDPTTAADGDPITVTVSIPYSSVSWLPVSRYFSGSSLSATVVMRRETVQ